MKKTLNYRRIVAVLIFFPVLFYGQQCYSNKLDFRTAYAFYTDNGCKPCWNVLEKTSPNDIPILEEQLVIGLISFLTQAHVSDGYYDLSDAQKNENARIEKLAKLFLDKGADINYIPDNSSGALLASVLSGNSNRFAFLVNNGADVNVINYIRGKPTTVMEVAKKQLASATKSKDSRLKKSISRIIKIIKDNQHTKLPN